MGEVSKLMDRLEAAKDLAEYKAVLAELEQHEEYNNSKEMLERSLAVLKKLKYNRAFPEFNMDVFRSEEPVAMPEKEKKPKKESTMSPWLWALIGFLVVAILARCGIVFYQYTKSDAFYMKKANTCITATDYAGALDYLGKIKDPSSVEGYEKASDDCNFKLGVKNFDTGKYEKALGYFEAIQSPSDDAVGYLDLCYCRQALADIDAGKYEDALKKIEKCSKNFDEKEKTTVLNKANYALGKAAYKSGDTKAAQAYFDACSGYGPANKYLFKLDYAKQKKKYVDSVKDTMESSLSAGTTVEIVSEDVKMELKSFDAKKKTCKIAYNVSIDYNAKGKAKDTFQFEDEFKMDSHGLDVKDLKEIIS